MLLTFPFPSCPVSLMIEREKGPPSLFLLRNFITIFSTVLELYASILTEEGAIAALLSPPSGAPSASASRLFGRKAKWLEPQRSLLSAGIPPDLHASARVLEQHKL